MLIIVDASIMRKRTNSKLKSLTELQLNKNTSCLKVAIAKASVIVSLNKKEIIRVCWQMPLFICTYLLGSGFNFSAGIAVWRSPAGWRLISICIVEIHTKTKNRHLKT